MKLNEYRIDNAIRAKEVRVIGPEGEQLGIMPLYQAKSKAMQMELNLVEIASNSKPIVCKIMDYGKFKFNKAKKLKEQKQQVQLIKEIKFRLNIEEHDIQTKVKHIQKFLDAKNKVKITVMFRGRETSYPDLGVKIIEKVLNNINMPLMKKPILEGKNMSIIIDPLK